MQKARTFRGAGSFVADREGSSNKYAYRRKGTETAQREDTQAGGSTRVSNVDGNENQRFMANTLGPGSPATLTAYDSENAWSINYPAVIGSLRQ